MKLLGAIAFSVFVSLSILAVGKIVAFVKPNTNSENE